MARSLVLPFAILFLAIGVSSVILSTVRGADVQTLVTITICSDGVLQEEFEVCDEGPGGNLGMYASTTADRTCAPGCESFGPYCGDDILQVRFGEECDDGNHTNGDLCNATCEAEVAVPETPTGSPTVGSTPSIPGADPGTIPSVTETRVVLRGKAYPGSEVSVLLDGKVKGTARADTNADFQYSTTDITPGTATFGFFARDKNNIDSITTSVVFEVVQSAVTTVGNVFFPPTIAASAQQVQPGELVTISGQTVPESKVVAELNVGSRQTLNATADGSGEWAIQVNTGSFPRGRHTAKSYFEQSPTVRSGFGKSVGFGIGSDAPGEASSSDVSGDTKVNLVDFSIFLLAWGKTDARSDFNGDGTVNLADFSIMLFNWTG